MPDFRDSASLLVLNETRKTLLASRLRAETAERGESVEIRPGEVVWLEAGESLDPERTAGLVDLVFVDSDRRVVETMTGLRPEGSCPGVPGAAAILQLAPGTVPQSHTEKGDQILIETVADR